MFGLAVACPNWVSTLVQLGIFAKTSTQTTIEEDTAA